MSVCKIKLFYKFDKFKSITFLVKNYRPRLRVTVKVKQNKEKLKKKVLTFNIKFIKGRLINNSLWC